MRVSAIAVIAAMLFVCAEFAMADSVAGDFSDGKLTLHLVESSGAFTGTVLLNGKSYPTSVHGGGSTYQGSFTAGGSDFPMTIALSGDNLTLTTGGTTYTLNRAGQVSNPLAANLNSGKLPQDYVVVLSTDAGQSLTVKKSNSSSVQAALQATLDALKNYFGAKITIGRGYQNAGDKNSGGATFTSVRDGKPIQGLISCKVDASNVATIAVVFSRSDASKAEWDKLMNPPAAPANADAAAPAKAAPVDPAADAKLLGPNAKVYQYPDGTGSITLPEGWTTKASSAIDPIQITGPADQGIGLGIAANVYTNESPLVKLTKQNELTQQRNARMMKQMGGTMPPPPPGPKPSMLTAEFTSPMQALQDLQPQISEMNKARGMATGVIDKVVKNTDMPSQDSSKTAGVEYLVTRTYPDGTTKQFDNVQLVRMMPGPQGSGAWMLLLNGFWSPATTIDKDKPLMWAIIRSQKINNDALQQVAQQRTRQIQQQGQQNMAMIKQQGDALNAQLQANHDMAMQNQQTHFEIGQEQHQAQMDSYAQHNAQFKQDELTKARNKDDFVETIQGTRTIYDSQTGQAAKADLTSAGAVVDYMNQQALDPNRFIQIPLRDEMDPVPAGR